jgi:hypothetical protein
MLKKLYKTIDELSSNENIDESLRYILKTKIKTITTMVEEIGDENLSQKDTDMIESVLLKIEKLIDKSSE